MCHAGFCKFLIDIFVLFIKVSNVGIVCGYLCSCKNIWRHIFILAWMALISAVEVEVCSATHPSVVFSGAIVKGAGCGSRGQL